MKRAIHKLSDVQCRTLRPDPAAKTPPRLRDGGGLYLEALPSGRKVWRMEYAINGRKNRATLGTYPDVSLTLARDLAREVRSMLAKGLDPNAEKARQRERAENETKAVTFVGLMERWAADELEHRSADYRAGVLRRLELHVTPYLGKRPFNELMPSEFVPVFDRLRQSGREETVRRIRTNISQAYRWALRRDLVTFNPMDAFKGERRIKPRGHFSALTEPADVARLMQAIWSYRGSAQVCALLKMSALLWQRPGELRRMKWDEIDLEAATWRYFVTKTGVNHLVPLPRQAVAILRDLQPLTDRPSEYRSDLPNYVFPSPKSRELPLSENAARVALRTLGFSNDEHTPHGFRATARSLLAELGWKPDAIERQLAHSKRGPLGAAYDRAAFLAERREMMQAWADYLDSLRTGTGRVVAIRGRAA